MARNGFSVVYVPAEEPESRREGGLDPGKK